LLALGRGKRPAINLRYAARQVEEHRCGADLNTILKFVYSKIFDQA